MKVVMIDPLDLIKWRATKANPDATIDDFIALSRERPPSLEDWTEYYLDQNPNDSAESVRQLAEEAYGRNRDADMYSRVYGALPYPPPKDDPMYDAWKGRLHEALRAELTRLKNIASLNGQVRFTPLDSFLREADEELEWLADGLIPLDALIQFLGKLESFKSMAMLGLHVACAYGGTWLGRSIPVLPSFYVSGEKRRRSIRDRLLHLTNAEPGPQLADLIIVHRSGLKIDPRNEQWLRLVDEVAQRKERTVVGLDTITSLAPTGFNENSGESWAEVLDGMRMLTDLPEPATVLGSFHPSKADAGGIAMQSRGHTSFGGEADGAIVFSRPNRATDTGTIHARPKDGSYEVIPFFWDRETYRIVPKDLTTLVLTNDTMVTVVATYGPCDFETIVNAYGYDEAGKRRYGEDRVRAVLKSATEAGLIETERANANQRTQYFIPEGEEG